MKKIVSSLCVVAMGALLFLGAQKDVAATAKGAENLSDLWYAKEGDECSILDYNLEDYVKLGNYKGMDVSVNHTEVTKDTIIASINQMLTEYPDYNKLDKDTVENGDIVDIDYVGKVDGKEFDGGTDTGFHLGIGSGSFIEGFESGLVGAKVGDTVTLNLTFPKDYHEDLAGKDVVFEVKINEIDEEVYYTYDDVTDKFVSKNLGFDNVKALYDYVSKYYEEAAANEEKSNTRTAVIDKLMEVSEVKTPEELLDFKVRDYLVSYREQMEANQQNIEEQIKADYNYTPAEFEQEVRSMMDKSIKSQMLLYAIAQKEGIKADKAGFDEYVAAFVSYYKFESKEELFKEFPEKELKLAYTCNSVTDFLVENSKVTLVSDEDKAE